MPRTRRGILLVYVEHHLGLMYSVSPNVRYHPILPQSLTEVRLASLAFESEKLSGIEFPDGRCAQLLHTASVLEAHREPGASRAKGSTTFSKTEARSPLSISPSRLRWAWRAASSSRAACRARAI